MGGELTRPMPVGWPCGRERTRPRTTSYRIERSLHIPFSGNQVPARRQEFGGFDAASFVNFLGRAVPTIAQHFSPHDIAITFYHGMGSAKLMRFVGVKC